LVSWEPITDGSATFKVFVNPLVSWVWLGGLVFILGTLIAAWPEREMLSANVPIRSQTRGLPAEAKG
jgi:cytochrome c-type biogenesis protein CcmF